MSASQVDPSEVAGIMKPVSPEDGCYSAFAAAHGGRECPGVRVSETSDKQYLACRVPKVGCTCELGRRARSVRAR